MCIPWIIKILLTTNLQQKSPCPPCIPWITKISGSPTYKKKRRYSHTTSSALHKNPYLIYFFSCKYTNKTDTIQIFPYIFLFLFVKLKFLFNFVSEMSAKRGWSTYGLPVFTMHSASGGYALPDISISYRTGTRLLFSGLQRF